MGDEITCIDSGEAVASEIKAYLEQNGLSRRDTSPRFEEFYVTDSAARFRRVAELFLGRPLDAVETVELGAG
jgi:glutamate racemase